MREIEQAVKTMREVLIEYPKRFGWNEEELKRLRAEERDLLHLIELTAFNAHEGFELSKELQKLRQRRRELIDENNLLRPTLKLGKLDNIQKNKVNDAIGEIRQTSKIQANRGYRMKIRDDLQERFDKRILTKKK